MEKFKSPRENAVADKILKKSKLGRVASFIGNEVIPELGMLQAEGVNIRDRDTVIKYLEKGNVLSVAKYLKTLSPSGYQALIKHVLGT